MTSEQSYGAHSAHVKMRLLVNGLSLRITHMGPDFVLLDSPADHPPAEARIFLKVDESEREWSVTLPNGISKTSNRVPLALSR